jgi:hypothetical protein
MSKENLLLSTLSIQFTSLQNTVVLGFRYVCIFGVSYMIRFLFFFYFLLDCFILVVLLFWFAKVPF